jgi:hypothetical protein
MQPVQRSNGDRVDRCWYDGVVSSRQERAAFRRAHWSGEVVPIGQPKPPMYRDASYEDRLLALWRLSVRAWRASGGAAPAASPRASWPGWVFELGRRG